ncbi:MAG: polysaccharide deacetylase family protein [Gammaproteobacteria bacterium]
MYRQLIKDLLVPGLASRWISSIASGMLGYGIPIFMLHRIYPDNLPGQNQTPAYLRKCLTYLKGNGYHFVSVAEIIQSVIHNTTLPDKSVAFTIDDGFHDQASLAAPIFIEFKCPATIFLITDYLDGKLWPWFSQVQYMIETTKVRAIEFGTTQEKTSYPLASDKQKRYAIHAISELIKRIDWSRLDTTLAALSNITEVEIPDDPPDHYKPMTWSLARKLEEQGIMFGPHTLTHPILSRVSDEQSHQEIAQSWQRLKQELQNPAPVFCYPNGDQSDYGQREIEILKKTDMLGAVSTIPMQYSPESTEVDIAYNLPRYGLPGYFTDFLMYCSWIEFAKEKIRKRLN